MHKSTFDRMLAIEMKELAKLKMLTVYLNKLLESNFDSSVLDLDGSCATLFNCVEKKLELECFDNFELECFDNFSILKAITSFLNTNIERQASLDTIQIPQIASSEGKQELDTLMKHASISYEMRHKSFTPWSPFTLCYLLMHHSRFKKILRNTLAHGTRQDKVRQILKNLKTSAALQAALRSHGDLTMHTHQTDQMSKLSATVTFEDLLSGVILTVHPKEDLEQIKHIVAPTVANGRIVAHGYFSKIPDLKRRCNQPKLDMHFGVKSRIDALASYPIKFTHVAGMFMSILLPKRILVTASGALTSDTVVAGRRKKHFSQAFIGYLSPEYSKKYTSNCSKSVSIAGALTAIKSYLRRRKEEYYSKKAASTKKRKAPQAEQTYYTLTNSSDVFEEAGYGFYCF